MDNLIGKRLDGRYSIESLVGVGGMANVYRGTDLKTGNQIAVKVLKDEFLDNEELVRRFKNESKAISILSHPNIVKVYDVSVTDKLQYIVMEYVDGITLKEYLKQRGGALTWKETVHFATQILSALQHAHSKGIIHRDVKPQNIMLLADGSIKMMDFGIARFSRAQSQTVSDKAIGSVHYISPEQAKGERTDARTDHADFGEAEAAGRNRTPDPGRTAPDYRESHGKGPRQALPERPGDAGRYRGIQAQPVHPVCV